MIGLHVLFVAIFVGGNVVMDLVLTPGLNVIPPGSAAQLSNKIGANFANLTWLALGGIAVTGILLLRQRGVLTNVFNTDFLTGRYGLTVLTKATIFASLVVSGAVMTFYLRPSLVQKLPYDATRQDIDAIPGPAMRKAAWLQRLALYNMGASIVALFIGSFQANGGFV